MGREKRGRAGRTKTERRARLPGHAELEQRLLESSFPRLQMLLIVAIAALGTFLSSASLLSFGLHSMAVRYLLAVLCGYAFFLTTVRAWIAYQRRGWGSATEVGIDLQLPDLPLGSGAEGVAQVFSGTGGDFGGAGASGSYAGEALAELDLPSAGGGSGAGEVLDGLGSADEGFPILIAFAVALAGAVALGFVVYSSPALFAEVLLDVAVVGAVYRKNKRHERAHWTRGVVRRTYVPAFVLAALAAVLGLVQAGAPDEVTLGGALEAYGQESAK